MATRLNTLQTYRYWIKDEMRAAHGLILISILNINHTNDRLWTCDILHLSDIFWMPLSNFYVVVAKAVKETAQKLFGSDGGCTSCFNPFWQKPSPSVQDLDSQLQQTFMFPCGLWMIFKFRRHYYF